MAMAPLGDELAHAFSERYATVSLDVTVLGTQFGLDALQRGEADVALASWLPDDLGARWKATAIARDGLAVIVHPTNPVDGLGLLQLRDLFGGRVYDWEAVGGRAAQGQVQPVSREEGSGARAAFEVLVMDDRPLTPLAIVAPSSNAVIDYVAQNPAAIGFVSMVHVSPDVKALSIEGEIPTPQSAGRGSYPLTRELWLVTAERPAAVVRDLLDFVLSPAGQEIVGRRYGRIR
jgi:phosphate transport system substrate-binding protein